LEAGEEHRTKLDRQLDSTNRVITMQISFQTLSDDFKYARSQVNQLQGEVDDIEMKTLTLDLDDTKMKRLDALLEARKQRCVTATTEAKVLRDRLDKLELTIAEELRTPKKRKVYPSTNSVNSPTESDIQTSAEQATSALVSPSTEGTQNSEDYEATPNSEDSEAGPNSAAYERNAEASKLRLDYNSDDSSTGL
jgi:hypothetical protein